jgi:2Fe-2S ferredoxin
VAELLNEIHFLPCDRRIAFTKEASVLEVALKNGVEINHSCGGMGSCTTCRVLIVKSEAALPERGELEQEIADMRGFRKEERLACQLPPLAGLVVEVPVT